jgi:hypothetical protein
MVKALCGRDAMQPGPSLLPSSPQHPNDSFHEPDAGIEWQVGCRQACYRTEDMVGGAHMPA